MWSKMYKPKYMYIIFMFLQNFLKLRGNTFQKLKTMFINNSKDSYSVEYQQISLKMNP